MIECRLGDHSRVTCKVQSILPITKTSKRRHTEPPAIGLYTTGFRFVFSLLKIGSLNYLAIPVADRLSAREQFYASSLFGIAIKIFALYFFQRDIF